MMDKLLGLSRVKWSDPAAGFGWRQELDPWMWAMIVLAAGVFAFWSYSRLAGSRAVRTALSVVRALLIVFVAMLIAGPMLVLTQETVEPDWLLVMVDRSASIGIQDMLGPSGTDGPDAQRISRHEALQQALRSQGAVFSDEALGRNRRVVWLGFDSSSYAIDDPAALQPPAGSTTAIRTAIEQALQRAAGQPISGIVMFTDGRSAQPTGADLVRRLNQQAIGVFPVPLGAQSAPLDLAVGQIDIPQKAFVNDIVPVNVWLDRYPADAAVDVDKLRLRLIDVQTGKTLDERPPADAQLAEPILLRAESASVGQSRWKVELVYDEGNPTAELILENNTREVRVDMVDRPIRALYVEGYPRWEYRYLKNLLIREKSIESSTMLISADRQFAQEGDVPIARLPRDAQEMAPYDVIIIGDVPGSYFSSTQLALIRDQVAMHGAGLLWIGGGQSTPRTYENTELAPLLPMRHPGSIQTLSESVGGVAIKPTPLARSLSVMRMKSMVEGEDHVDNWPTDLPRLLWTQQLADLKPTAEVLAEGFNDQGSLGPVLVRLRYGAGQVLYSGTDDFWRYRYAIGDFYHEQLWMQLIRMLGRTRIQQDSHQVQFEVSHRRVSVDQSIVVTLKITDAMLIRRNLPRVSVVVERDGGAAPEAARRQVERFELMPVLPATDGTALPDGVDPAFKQYQAIWRPLETGDLLLRLDDPALADLGVAQRIEVFPPDDELRQPAPDHDRLKTLAEQTQGAVVQLDNLGELGQLLPNRARRTPNDIREPLWNSWLSLLLVVGLITVEWIGRKAIRLV